MMYAIGPGGQRGLQIVPRHSISLSHVNVPHVPLFLSPGQLETRCIPSTHHQYSRRSSLAVVTAATGPNSDENSNFGGGKWEGQGVGPEGLEDDPVLHDLLMGMGASGAKSAGEKPAGAPDKMSAEEASAALAMGTWRLRPRVSPVLEALVSQIESAWRVILGSDLGLYALPQRYRYMDSLDPGGSQPLSHQFPDPEKGDARHPRLQVENRAYRSHAFRKLHLEVGVRQDGLQVVHCVMYPRLEFDLPILSMDLVANGDRVTLAIVDPCPVNDSLTLPPFYAKATRELQAKYGLESNRSVPEWGSAIFSKLCVIVRPQSPEDVAAFLKYAIALTNFHLHIGRLATPVRANAGESGEATERRRAEIRAAHERYCAKQLENDKTKKVLEKAFGSGPADEYMRTVMFDVPPPSPPGGNN